MPNTHHLKTKYTTNLTSTGISPKTAQQYADRLVEKAREVHRNYPYTLEDTIEILYKWFLVKLEVCKDVDKAFNSMMNRVDVIMKYKSLFAKDPDASSASITRNHL